MDRNLKASLSEAWQRYHVKKAWLFGSRARDGSSVSSDWDFLVEFSSPPSFDDYMGLKETVEQAVHGKADILSLSACKPRFLRAIKKDLVDVS